MKNQNGPKRGLLVKLALSSCLALSFANSALGDVTNPVIGEVLFEENFNTFDSTRWNVNIGNGCPDLCGWGNAELEYYSANNVYIADVPGEPGNKAVVLEARNDGLNGYAFTSGKIDSENGVAVQYGMIEFRVRIPGMDTGLWPAVWMLGTSAEIWPAKGEIDMMEMGHSAQGRAEAGHAGANLNYYTAANVIYYSNGIASTAWQTDNAHVSATPITERFVTYRTYWTDTQIRFTVIDNGVEYDMYNAPIQITAEGSELQQPFYLLANLAVGGNFTDAASAGQVTAAFPAKMYLDYIKVYQLDGLGEVFDGSSVSPESGTLVEAEDYIAYSDTTSANLGGAYRTDGVDLEATSEGGFNVGWTETGEWLEYGVTLVAGTYNVSARVASLQSAGTYSVFVNGSLVNSSTVATNGWQNWETQQLGQITIASGEQSIRVTSDIGGYNLNWLQFELVEAAHTLIDNGDTTIDTASGLEWLDLTFTQGVSAQDVLAGFGGYIDAGWTFATVEQVCGLFEALGDDTTNCTTGAVAMQMNPANAETLVNLMGSTTATGRGAYGMFNNIDSFPNNFGIGCLNDTATSCTGGGGSSWLTLIEWASGYATVGSFLVRPASTTTLIDNGDTTIDTASGLEWLDLTFTQGVSAQDVLAGYGGYIDAGWTFATVEQVCGLFGALGDDTTNCTTGAVAMQMNPANAETLVNLLGNTAATGRGAYGMFNNIDSFPNNFGIGCLNDTATSCTGGGGSSWLTLIEWASGYATVGSFLVR